MVRLLEQSTFDPSTGVTQSTQTLIDSAGAVIAEKTCSRGLLNVGAEGFEATLVAEFGDWLAAPGVRCLMAGMVDGFLSGMVPEAMLRRAVASAVANAQVAVEHQAQVAYARRETQQTARHRARTPID